MKASSSDFKNHEAMLRRVGAIYEEGSCAFRVWAPERNTVSLHIVEPADRKEMMVKDDEGYFTLSVPDVTPGTLYFYSINGGIDCPDPASHAQPRGVHGPSMVVDQHAYQWRDAGKPLPCFDDFIIYEIHVGTFTPEGTFAGIITKLPELKNLGITAIELMPVGQFPGHHNWGYDGVFPYAVQQSYGGPNELKKLVDACHHEGIAVILDVVYNHFGPEGNYFDQFGPYYSDTYHMPWGKALNYDGSWSDGVRNYIAGNVIYWLEHYHIDGLRLDAIHTIYDSGAVHILEFIYLLVNQAKQRLGKNFYLIAENDANSIRATRHPESGGFGFDAQWLDDFHHAFYVLLDKKGGRLYEDFGSIEQLSKAFMDGFVHSGEYVSFRKKRHGASSAGVTGNKFIVFNQNHDQVGNRGDGARLASLVNLNLLKIAAAGILLSPYIPMLFMGEEYGETAPFYFFVDHSEKELIRAVKVGRQKDFERLLWEGELPPDPDSEQAFLRSKLTWDYQDGNQKILYEWNRRLLWIRKTYKIFKNYLKNDLHIHRSSPHSLLVHRRNEEQTEHALIYLNLSDQELIIQLPNYSKQWEMILDSSPEFDSQFIPAVMVEGEKIAIQPQSVVVAISSSVHFT
jgi:maltooligosyltrehalose trehalohydrolase